jgi:hypothetical protein
MKLKALLLPMLIILADSKFLKSKRTKQDSVDIPLSADQITLPNDVGPFYIFCTINNFKEYDKLLSLKNSEDNLYVQYSEDDLARLKICIYDLRVRKKKTIKIQRLLSFTYSEATRTWHIRTQTDFYVVNTRFGDAILDFSSEIISLRYYTTVLLYSQVKASDSNTDLKISKELKQVYDSFEYIDVLFSFYKIITEPSEAVKDAFGSLGRLCNGLELNSISEKNIKLETIINPDNLRTLSTIFEDKDLKINILLAMIDEGNRNLNGQLLTHLKNIVDTGNIKFADLLSKIRSAPDLKLLQHMLELNQDHLNVLLEYMKDYENLGEAIRKHCNGNNEVDKILAMHENSSGNAIWSDDELSCIKVLKAIKLNKVVLSKQNCQNLVSKKTNAPVDLRVIDILYKENDDFMHSLIRILDLNNSSNRRINETELKALGLAFNHPTMVNPSSGNLKTLTELFSNPYLVQKIFYEMPDPSSNKVNITKCFGVLRRLKKYDLDPIRSILELNQNERETFKTIQESLLVNGSIINLKNAKMVFDGFPNLTLNTALKLSKIFRSGYYPEFFERIKPHIKQIQQGVLYYANLNIYISESSSSGSELGENLQHLFQRMAPLVRDFISHTMKTVYIGSTASQTNHADYMLVERSGFNDNNEKEESTRLLNDGRIDTGTATYQTNIPSYVEENLVTFGETEDIDRRQEQFRKRGYESTLTITEINKRKKTEEQKINKY